MKKKYEINKKRHWNCTTTEREIKIIPKFILDEILKRNTE